MNWQVLEGDCIQVMRGMEADSVDAVVCDPPYGINFMGKAWDGKAIADAAEKDRERRESLGPHSSTRPGRSEPRSSSAFGNSAGQAGAYDFTLTGNRAFQAWSETWATEALRVLKPGGHLLAFGGTRTYHRMVCAIEDAGFEIRDSVQWVYGSGFPKSLNVGKAIDKMAGAEREVVGSKLGQPGFSEAHIDSKPYEADAGNDWTMPCGKYNRYDQTKALDITAPATEAAKQWEGFGTALKPAHEPIVLARKPLSESSVARNVLEHGTGALNIDGCRVQGAKPDTTRGAGGQDGMYSPIGAQGRIKDDGQGRWPANLLLSHSEGCRHTGEVRRVKGSDRPNSAGKPNKGDGGFIGKTSKTMHSLVRHSDPDGTEAVEAWECVDGCPIREMDEQSGNRPGSHKQTPTQSTNAAFGGGRYDNSSNYSDKGGASRFFQQFTPDTSPGFLYQAKSSRAERNKGLEGMPEQEHHTHNHAGRDMSKPTNAMGEGERKRVERGEPAMRASANNHPTVKPIVLMRYLCRLITPPGGMVLDPFAGSGSTGCAAVQEGFSFIGIEMDSEYAEIARRRIAYWSQPEEKNGKAHSKRLDTSSQSSNRLERSSEASLF